MIKVIAPNYATYLKGKESWQNQNEEEVRQLQWELRQHYMLLPMINFGEPLSLLLGQDQVHLPPAIFKR